MDNKLNIAYRTVATYIVVIAIGMFVSFHFFDASYTSPKMFDILWFVEIILSSIVIFSTVKFFSWKHVGFNKIDKSQLYWLVPTSIVIVSILIGMINSVAKNGISDENLHFTLMIFVTTLLVGFSEELMFRGILLNTLLKTTSKTKAVVISSLAFGALHIVNMLSGVSFGGMITQFILTTIFGMLFALIYIRIKNIVPLMIIHFLWDFTVIGNMQTGYVSEVNQSFVAPVYLIIEIVLVIILFVKLRKETTSN